MIKTLGALIISCLTWAAAVAEDIPPPRASDVRYHIEIPKGGLPAFLKWQPMRIPMISHHRSGPSKGFPENAIETMDHVLAYGPGMMEIDVATLADGTMILMHDDTFNRTTTGEGLVSLASWESVSKFKLIDDVGSVTDFAVPTLEAALRWTIGRAILTLDIKRGTDFAKVAALVAKTGADDYVVAIAYTLDQAKEFHAAAPTMPITITMRNDDEIAAVLASGIPSELVVAWTGTERLPSDHYQALHDKGWRVIMGTLGGARSIDTQIAANDNDKRYLSIYNQGVDVIATDRFWAVQRQIQNPNFFLFTKKQAVSAE